MRWLGIAQVHRCTYLDRRRGRLTDWSQFWYRRGSGSDWCLRRSLGLGGFGFKFGYRRRLLFFGLRGRLFGWSSGSTFQLNTECTSACNFCFGRWYCFIRLGGLGSFGNAWGIQKFYKKYIHAGNGEQKKIVAEETRGKIANNKDTSL